ncbi:MAG TPA: tetratricopeptide repeat protein [Anaerolineales bacterium]|nr:tetratricopeptide repeat protein [Anaerolineales bacterium]
MPELAAEFESLPVQYQHVIRLAQDRHNVTVTPLQELVGGWSGAMIYLVSVLAHESGRVEHLILKLDRKGKSSKSDEVTRHNLVLSKSPPGFTRQHVPEIAFDRVEYEGAIGIFYGIAGQSLRNYRPLSSYGRESQLITLFTTTNRLLLSEWNMNLTFEQAVHPQRVLEKWLGFRLDPGGNIERFFYAVCGVYPEISGIMIGGNIYPNPFAYARKKEYWGTARAIDIMLGFSHGDLNANNILVKFSDNGEVLEGCYLIDFALFKEGMPLLYDQRYLEMSYLIHSTSQVSFEKGVEFITRLAEVDILDPHLAPIEMAGVSAVIASGRGAFGAWVRETHPSLHDDLWGQYWLAGVAAGLSYCHKAGQPDEQRLAGLIYAAANLKRYAALFALPSPTEVAQLYNEGQFRGTSRSPSVTRTSSAGPHHNLPVQATTFIGREEEIARTREMLFRKDVRLVTLTGPGGTGKTRLSLETASGLIERFKHGVVFVPLADVSEPHQLVSRIAQALEVREAGSQPLLENLKDYLRDKNILVILDNFEQLIAAGWVVADLLAAAPSLKVLVTSRILLNLRGEHELPIDPLDIPDPADLPSVERLRETESVRLFVARAQATNPSFTLSDENASAVARICQRLDGLPLAIELAAARVKLLTPQAMLARLSDRLKLLTGGARDLPERQRTLRSTIDWSYDLLNPKEKTLFAHLAVFVGGFSLDTAEVVCNPKNNLDILEGVTSLLNNSLLRQEDTVGGEPRFRMLETIREYATERLVENGEMASLQKRHAHYFAEKVINKAGLGLFGPQATYWLNRLQLDYDNILAALAWTQAAPEGIELGPPLVTWLNWFWYRRGFFNEGRIWTERVLESSPPAEYNPARAMVIHMSALLAMWQGDLNVAESRARQGLALVQNLEDDQTMPWALMGTGVVLINMGKDSEAHALLKEAQTLFEEQGISYMQAVALVHLGNVALGLGSATEAREWLEQAHRSFREIGEEWGLSFVLNNLGEVARVQGDYDQAGRYYEESEALLRKTGDKGDLARLVHSLGYIALHREEYDLAGEQFRESLAMFRQLGNKRGIAECITGLASLSVKQGKLQIGARILGAAEALLGASGAAWWPADRVEVENTRAILQSELTKDEFTAAWAEGQQMTLDQAVAFVSNDPG